MVVEKHRDLSPISLLSRNQLTINAPTSCTMKTNRTDLASLSALFIILTCHFNRCVCGGGGGGGGVTVAGVWGVTVAEVWGVTVAGVGGYSSRGVVKDGY